MSPDEYVALLEERRDEWVAERGGWEQHSRHYPPLLEWFVRPGDEDLFTPPEPTPRPKPTRKPRTYLPASHWRAELARIDARLAALDPGPRHDTTDTAAYGGIGIRQTARQQRAWGERIDRTAAEYVRLTRRRDEVAAKLARAEKRETWTCQACGGPATESDGAVCTKCGQNRRSTPVETLVNNTHVVLESEGRTKTVPGGAGNANGDLTTGTSPALLGEGGKPDGYPA